MTVTSSPIEADKSPMRVRTNSGVGVGVSVGVAVDVAVGASVGVDVGVAVGSGVAVSVGGSVAVGGSGVDVAVEVGADVAVDAATVDGGEVRTASPCNVAGTGVEAVQPIKDSPNNRPIPQRAKRSICFICMVFILADNLPGSTIRFPNVSKAI